MLLHFVIGMYQIPRSLRDKNKRKIEKKQHTFVFFSYLIHHFSLSILVFVQSIQQTGKLHTKVGKVRKDGARILN